MRTLEIYKKLENKPFGKKIFSKLVCHKLPYFSSIRPLVRELDVGYAVVEMSDRRSVHNHIKSIHAIALCNLCEMAMAKISPEDYKIGKVSTRVDVYNQNDENVMSADIVLDIKERIS